MQEILTFNHHVYEWPSTFDFTQNSRYFTRQYLGDFTLPLFYV